MGQLTRQEMEAIIKRGESVLVGGVPVTKVEDLPDEGTLAAGDQQRTAAVIDSIDAQIAMLSQRRAQFTSATSSEGASTSARTGSTGEIRTADTSTPALAVLEGTVPELAEYLKTVDDVATLDALQKAEAAREPKPRAGALDAIEDRRRQLTGK